MLPTEDQEQRLLVQWLRVQRLIHHHSPNETGHTAEAQRRAGRMKAIGTSAGFPDLIVLIPPHRSIDGQGRFLCIEMKRQKVGTVSPAQRDWIAAINALETPHVAAYVCKGAEPAIELVSRHLASGRARQPTAHWSMEITREINNTRKTKLESYTKAQLEKLRRRVLAEQSSLDQSSPEWQEADQALQALDAAIRIAALRESGLEFEQMF